MLDPEKMTDLMMVKMKEKGFEPYNEFAVGREWWLALSEAIIESIKNDAELEPPVYGSDGRLKLIKRGIE